MAKKLLAVVVGYVVMAGIVLLAFSLGALFLGLDRIYKPGLYEPSSLWILFSLVVGILAAIAGGYVCRLIGRSRMLLHAFAGMVLVLGLILAAMQIAAPDDLAPREAGESIAEAASKSRQPTWLALLNPLIGSGGLLIGGSLRRDPPR